MQEFGSSFTCTLWFMIIYMYIMFIYGYVMLCLRILLYQYCTCNIYEHQQNTPKTNKLPSEFSHFWRTWVPLQKRQTRPRSKNSAKLSNSCNLQLPILQAAKKTSLSASGRNPGGMCLPGRRCGLRWNVWGSNQESFFCWLVMVLILDAFFEECNLMYRKFSWGIHL